MPARPRDNRTPDGAKRRWNADDRARRTGAAPARPARQQPAGENRTARRDARFGSSTGSAGSDGAAPRQDRRTDWYPGPRTNRRADRAEGERPAQRRDRDERPGRPREDRPERGREERPDRSWRASADAPARRSRPDRGDSGPSRPERSGSGRPRVDRSESARPFRTERSESPRPRRDRAEPGRAPRAESDRPRYDERPRRDDRGPRPARGDRAQDPGRRAVREERTPRWEAQEDVVLDRLEAEVVTAEEVAGSSFADLGLGQQITKALAELGATEPFPIQAATIPPALEGRNVLGRGRTGSGKTIAFGAALVERLMRNWAASGRTGTGRRMGRPPRALVLAPTRELALQIDRTVQPIARAVGLFTTQIVGGVPQGRQVGALSKGVDIVIGTPGRIEDLLEQGRLDLGEVEIAVLDEADHMAELGFLEPMQRLLARVPEGGQRMLFSATLDAAVAGLVQEFLPDPAVHEVADPEGPGDADHRVLVIDPSDKVAVLTALIGVVDRALVFARTRAFAEQLADDLEDAGVRTESLHGDLNQARRTRNLARFSEGRVAALVATDVAARGIHVDAIDLVIHADAAEDYKTYLHRSGRTGRAGASGTVVTLIGSRRRRRFTELLERAGIEAEFTVLHPGDDPVAAIRA